MGDNLSIPPFRCPCCQTVLLINRLRQDGRDHNGIRRVVVEVIEADGRYLSLVEDFQEFDRFDDLRDTLTTLQEKLTHGRD